MRSLMMAMAACVFLSGAAAGRADEPAQALPGVRALEKVMQRIMDQAEPAIACILVSRSDAYRRLGQGPAEDLSGRLGTFNPNTLDLRDFSDEERLRLRKKLDLADPTHVPEAFGSGVVVDPRGLILTNYHVVKDASKVFVRLPGGKGGYADIHAGDPRSDLAILRVLNPRILPLQAISLGDGGKVQRGQFVISLANPFAVGFRDGQPSASWGIVSNVRRRAADTGKEEERVKSLHHYGTLLQTDARLHLGCSGGALLDLEGELIGLTTALAAIQGGETPGGFAIPMDAGMQRILEVLKRGEEVDYGFLGVQSRGPSPGGVVLAAVIPGSPAAQEAKLRPQDVIRSINGAPVREMDDLFLALGTHLAGSKVQLEIARPGAGTLKTEAVLAKFQAPGKCIASSLGSRPFFRGLRVDYASLLVFQSSGLFPIPRGVLITDVQANSPAAAALLKAGEVITAVNGRAVPTPAAFYQAASASQGPVELTLWSSSFSEPPVKVVLGVGR